MIESVQKLILVFFVIFCGSVLSAQQIEISGSLQDADSESNIAGVEIHVEGNDESVTTDNDGNFVLFASSAGVIEVMIHHPDYEDLSVTIQPVGEKHVIGTIYMTSSATNEENLPTIVLSEQQFGDEDNGAEDVSGLLSASRDPFAQIAAFDLSWSRFRIRGLGAENQEMAINGILTNDLETGRIPWSNWGGLNDAVRARQDVLNLNVSDFAFGGLGGSANINIRPSGMRKMKRVSYALSNGNYHHRLMGFYNTGINKKGWGLALSASKRYAKEGYVEGTFYDAWSYFISIEKKINKKHSLNLASFGAHSKRGRSSAVVQEAYDLRDPDRKDLYNPNWGYQNGEKRNARVLNTFQPIFLITHDWTLNDKITIHTGGTYKTGKYSTGALDWNNASDPRPDYYRYLPSWEEDPAVADAVRQKWLTDKSVRQIDWHRLYEVNAESTETIKDVNGISGNDVTGLRSRYIVEERRFDPNVLSLSSRLTANISDKFQLFAGISYVKSRTDNYKQVDDLLGGDFVLDVDKFAESDFANPSQPLPDIIQSDLQHPNRLARVGDVVGYNYEIHSQQYKGWVQGKFENSKIIAYAGGLIGQASFWRNGLFQNGLHAKSSLGESVKQDDFIYSTKAGITFKVDGRNYIYANAAIGENPARARDGFLSPRVDNALNPYNDTWQHIGFDIGYQVRSPFIKARISVFYAERNNLVRSLLFYNDFKNSFGNLILGNLDYLHEGIEAGFELKVSPTLSLQGGGSISDNRINDRAISSTIDDRSLEFLDQDQIVYIEGFKIAGSPNTVANLGLTYRSPKFWFLGVKGNYFDDTYIDISPVRRTTEATELIDPATELYQSILGQEKVGGEFTVNVLAGYSYRIKHGETIRLFISINNILDNRDYISGGFEQLRFDDDNRDPNQFPSRYYYNYGRTFFASLTYEF